MGFASRSVSILRYRVRGEIEGSFWDTVHDGIRQGAFRVTDTPGDEIGIGWTSVEDFTDTEFRGESHVRGNYVALALRIDTVRVPPRILEIHLKKETRKILEESGRKRLSSAQRRELKDQVKEKLKHQAFPSIQVHDLIWDTEKAVVYFGSLAVKARERMEDHFSKCFGLTLIPLLMYIRAQEILGDDVSSRILEHLKPCSMVP
jgi:DNA recombination-dependent growth factor C